MLNDISSYRDIQLLITAFYEKVKIDDVLGVVFKERMQNHWEQHIEVMSAYWNGLILEGKPYHEEEFQKCARLPFERMYFDRWTLLFFEAVNEKFNGENADLAKLVAIKIALSFEAGCEHHTEI